VAGEHSRPNPTISADSVLKLSFGKRRRLTVHAACGKPSDHSAKGLLVLSTVGRGPSQRRGHDLEQQVGVTARVARKAFRRHDVGSQ
jgi:hypothetical protein